MLVTKEIHFHLGHRIPNHKSKCRNLHGHTYRLEVGVDDKLVTESNSSDEGMVIDFSDVKKIMVEEVYNELDHAFMMFANDDFAEIFHGLEGQNIVFVPFIPTAENIAKSIFLKLQKRFNKQSISLAYVRLWETPTSTATYTLQNSFDDNNG